MMTEQHISPQRKPAMLAYLGLNHLTNNVSSSLANNQQSHLYLGSGDETIITQTHSHTYTYTYAYVYAYTCTRTDTDTYRYR